MNEQEIRIASFFSGVGMLDRGLHGALRSRGYEPKTVLYCERDKNAQAILEARMRDGLIDRAPIWPDITTLDGGLLRGRVDAVVGGFPCQDLSVAGARAGLGEGTRSGLFFDLLRIATDSGARLIFLENVGGIVSAGTPVSEGDASEGGGGNLQKKEPSVWSSEPFPMPGLTLRGYLFALPILELPMGGFDGFALDGDGDDVKWPTPSVAASDQGQNEPDGKRGQTLIGAARGQDWATPSVFGNNNRIGAGPKSGDGLGTQVKQASTWATPCARDFKSGKGATQKDRGRSAGPSLSEQACLPEANDPARWPTPRAHDGAHPGATATASTAKRLEAGQANLTEATLESARWPTPRAGSTSGGGTGLDGGSGSRAMLSAALPEAEAKAMVTGLLNPEWVEILMGWPIGWTSTKPCNGIWPGWPAGMGPYQHHYEPKRLLEKGHTTKSRAGRLKACGNGVVPQQATAAFGLLLSRVNR